LTKRYEKAALSGLFFAVIERRQNDYRGLVGKAHRILTHHRTRAAKLAEIMSEL
jgi:hypothetical protein